MRNSTEWRPTKYVASAGNLRVSLDPAQVGVGSRIVADAVARRYAKHIPEHCRGRLLDLGCGYVPLYQTYRDYIDDVVCVDWPDSLHVNRYIDFYANLAEVLPITDGSFDTIILSDVLEHLPEPAKAWQEMARVLRPRGKLILNVPFYYWLHEEPHDYYRYTRHALRQFAEGAGFEVLVIESIGGVPEVLGDVTAKYLAMRGGRAKRRAKLVNFLVEHFLRSSAGRRMSERTAERFPLGYFMIGEKRT